MKIRRGLGKLLFNLKKVRYCYPVYTAEQEAGQRRPIVKRKLLMLDVVLVNGQAHG